MSRPPPSLRYNKNKVQTTLISPISEFHSVSWSLVQSLSLSIPSNKMINPTKHPNLNATNGYHPMRIASENEFKREIRQMTKKPTKSSDNASDTQSKQQNHITPKQEFHQIFQSWTLCTPIINLKSHSSPNLVSFGYLGFPLVFTAKPEGIAQNKYADFKAGFGYLMRQMECMSFVSDTFKFFPFHQNALVLENDTDTDNNNETTHPHQSKQQQQPKSSTFQNILDKINKFESMETQQNNSSPSHITKKLNTQNTQNNIFENFHPNLGDPSSFHNPFAKSEDTQHLPFIFRREKFCKMDLKSWFFEWPLQTKYNSRLLSPWSFSLPKRIFMITHAITSVPNFGVADIRTNSLVRWFLTMIPQEKNKSALDWCKLYPFWQNFLESLWIFKIINLKLFWKSLIKIGFQSPNNSTKHSETSLAFFVTFCVCARFNPLFASLIPANLFSNQNIPNIPDHSQDILAKVKTQLYTLYSSPIPNEFNPNLLQDVINLSPFSTALLFSLADQKIPTFNQYHFDSFASIFVYAWLVMVSRIVSISNSHLDAESRAKQLNPSKIEAKNALISKAGTLLGNVLGNLDISPILFLWQLEPRNNIPEMAVALSFMGNNFLFEKWLTRYINTMNIEDPTPSHYCFVLAWSKLSKMHTIPNSILEKN